MKRKLSYLLPTLVFLAPLLDIPGQGVGLGVPIQNEGIALLRPLGVVLGALLFVEIVAAAIRRHGMHDESPRGPSWIARILLVLGTVALAVFEWPLRVRIAGGQSITPFDRGTVAASVIALAAFLASWRGPWSGLLALVSGECLAGAVWQPYTLFRSDPDHLVAFIVEGAAAIVLTILLVVTVLYAVMGEQKLKEWDAFKDMSDRDLGFAPLAIAVFAKTVARVTLDLDGLRNPEAFAFSDAWDHFDAAILALSLGVARQVQTTPDVLGRAGLRSIFREQEIALVPWALATVVKWALGMRLSIGLSGIDPTLSAGTANVMQFAQVPIVAFYAVWIGSLAGLKPYLRWAGSPAPQEDARLGSAAL